MISYLLLRWACPGRIEERECENVRKMAKTRVRPPKRVVERNIALTAAIMRYLLDQPRVFNALPERFELVILPEDDPEIRLYNLQLLDAYGAAGKPIVFARIRSGKARESSRFSPSLFVPATA